MLLDTITNKQTRQTSAFAWKTKGKPHGDEELLGPNSCPRHSRQEIGVRRNG